VEGNIKGICIGMQKCLPRHSAVAVDPAGSRRHMGACGCAAFSDAAQSSSATKAENKEKKKDH
jgi:hypothetical protein